MALPAVLQRVLDWLHAGYPHGIPQTDYYPLLAFLARSLKPDEVSEVVSSLEAEYQRRPPDDVQLTCEPP